MTTLEILAVSEEAAATLQSVGMWVAAFLTLCIFSFLYKDNPLYKFAEHVMVGLAMGYFTIYYVLQVLEPLWYNRLFLNELQPSDELFGSTQAFRFGMIVPAVFGVMMLLRLVPRTAWLSRWSMALIIGISSGFVLPWTVQTRLTTHLLMATEMPAQYCEALMTGTHYGFTDVVGWSFGVPILIAGTVCALIYFFFSVPHRGVIGYAARGGIWVLMVGFGASFGYTVMARLSLLIGRVLFLLKDWLGLITT